MKKKILIIAGMLFGILSFSRATLTVDMGGAVLQSGGYYTYPNATVTGSSTDKGYVIRIMFTRAVTNNDRIDMPATLPSGWTQQSTDGTTPLSSQYVRVYSNSAGAATDQLQAFLRLVQVKFDPGKRGQEVMVLISENSADANRYIYYFSETLTPHYYEYEGTGKTWINAYNDALKTTFMGMTGYLANITSADEQKFIITVAKGVQGWIGGTRDKFNFNSDSTIAGVNSHLNYYYWSSGPEFDDYGRNPANSVFYPKWRISASDASVTIKPEHAFTAWNTGAWNTGEPNSSGDAAGDTYTTGKGEFYVQLVTTGLWNDLNGTSGLASIIEYRGEPTGAVSKSAVGFNCTKSASLNGVSGNGTSDNPVPVYPGDVITYTIKATNASENNTSVTVTDVIPEGWTASDISNGGSYNPVNRTITWNLSILADGAEEKAVTFKATPLYALPGGDALLPFANSASVISDGGKTTIRTNSTYHQIKRAKVTFAVDEPGAANLSISHNPWTVDYGRTLSAASVDANATAKPGYVFNSWSYPAYTDLKTGSARPSGSNAAYTNFTVYGDMTVTANFDTIPYHIHYTLNGGVNHASNPDKYHVKTATITLQSPTRAGYHFDGWKNSANTQVTEIPTGSTGDTTLVAHWTEITANPIESDTLCNGATIPAVTFSSGLSYVSSYKWAVTNPALLGLPGSSGTLSAGSSTLTFNPTVNSGPTPLTDTISVTPIEGTNPGTPVKFGITVNPTPQVIPTPNDTVCNGGTTEEVNFGSPVTGATTIRYKWENINNLTGFPHDGNGDISPQTLTNGGNEFLRDSIVVTPYFEGFESCPGPKDTFLVILNPTPQVTPTPNDTICNGAAVSLSFTSPVTGVTPVVYTWEHRIDGSGTDTGEGDLSFTGVNTGSGVLKDSIIVTPHIGKCEGPKDTILVCINPTPQVIPTPNDTVCNGTAMTLIDFTTPVTGTTVTYTWTSAGDNIGMATSGTDSIPAFIAVNSGASPLTDTVTVTPHIGGCDGPAETFTITVNPTPTVITPPNDTVCNNTTVSTKTFGTTVSGATVNYKWKATSHTLLGLSSGAGTGSSITFTGPASNAGLSPRTDTVTVTPYIAGFDGCPGATDTFLIVVNPTATVNAIHDTVYYDGQSVASMTATSPTTPAADVTFSWTNSNTSIGLAASGTGPTIPGFTAAYPSATGSVTATITVTPKYKDCPGTPETFTVTVKPRPAILYDYDSGTAPFSLNPTNYVTGVGCTVSSEPTRLGYTFQGWTCTELGVVSPVKPFIVPATATANLTLKAGWGTATPYNIIYHLDGAAPVPANPNVYDVNTTFTLTAPTKTGATFVGWTGTDMAGPLPQLDVTVPTGMTGDREYTAHWGFLFASDTVYSCTPPVTLQSGHDGQSYEWTLPDGSRQTAADIQATATGKYVLATNYGANSIIAEDSVFVLFAFDSDVEIERVSAVGTKINLPQVFTVPLNPEIIAAADNITWNWSFPDGNPLTSATIDTVSVVYGSTGAKTVSVRIGITRGAQFCEKVYTYDFEIHTSIRGFFVNCNVAGGTGDGSSWSNAFRTVQEALGGATEGDYIWVARGDYRPDAGMPYVLTRDSVEIYGGFAATETYLYERNSAANPTVLHGNGNSVIYTEGVSNASRWDGFIVEGGDAALGGGMMNRNSSVTVANSIIRGNSADNGGGIFNEGGKPVLYNVEISGNTAIDGGAMYNVRSSPLLTHVTVGGNYASAAGGGLYNLGGSSPVLQNTIVWGNRSATAPGICNDGSSVPNIASSLVEGSRIDGIWNVATGVDGDNNLDTSPAFRKQGFDSDGHMQQGIYQLYDFSPAIDRGNNGYVFYVPMRWNIHLQTQQNTATTSASTGKDLAGNARIENSTVDMGAYEFFMEENRPTIVREVTIPQVEGLTTVPPAGRHAVQSSSDFVFTVTPKPNYSLDYLDVKTGVPLRDEEGLLLGWNEDGSVTIIILQVTESLTLTINGVFPSAAKEAGDAKVWSYSNHLYVRTDRDADLQIRTPAGILYKRQQVSAGDTAIMLPQGFYIVTLDGKMYKVVIK